MSLPSKIKEQSRLLDLSSDEESDLQLEIIPNRKRKITRKERNKNAAPKASEPDIGKEVHCALCWAVRGTLLLWLLMLTWICAALYDQVTTMKFDVDKVSTSSAGVGDELQVCHTQAKELRTNASELSARLSKLELDFQELSKQMTQTAKELSSVSEQLSAAPKLADMPRRLAELQRTVADFGSQISGFDSSLTSTRKQASTAASGVDELKTQLSQLEGRTNDTVANLTIFSTKNNETRELIVALNTTLVSRIDGLEAKIVDMNKPLSTVAPATSSTVAPSAAPSVPVAPANANTTIPGPAKPIVLQ
ncbi:uncharacterized protein LOC112057989 isoform X2 [Bicyclus anynana]|uniref:Uncharacterized protein LOC112057989 isoform X2 n=1 Tax=Bicyclus anynana TaxID=110368 RepID=A0A6J1P9K8_BICAN|nr:uncharacterized protein LOC112057989 isoform X2 [Bicyclus anynana]XP_023954394.2 uncharacterized protein LOC112057989 isoform X2 [Bicyclus anynana]